MIVMAMHRKVVPTTPRRPHPDAQAPTGKKIVKIIVNGAASQNGASTLKK